METLDLTITDDEIKNIIENKKWEAQNNYYKNKNNKNKI
jgi:hypothetical protein